MEKDKYRSELGDIVITRSHLERSQRCGEWKEIKQAFDQRELVDKIHFSKIEDLDYQPESFFPYLKIKTDGEWKKVVMAPEDSHKEIFKRLRYRLKSYRQVYD